MNNRTKQQHYVSRFYLDHFKDSDGFIWTYDTANAKRWSATPENTARQSNLYTPKDESGEFIDDVEELFSKIESTAAELYPKVLQGIELFEQDRADFSVFIASLYARSPANIRQAAELAGSFVQLAHDALLSNKSAYDKSWDDYDAAKGTTTAKEQRDSAYEFGKDKSRYSVVVKQKAGLVGLSMIDTLTHIFYDMKWDLIRIEGQHLITSDNPVVRVADPKEYHPIYGDGGFIAKGTYVTLPLTPNRLLRLSWSDEKRGQTLLGGKEHGRLFNRQRAYCSDSYLFSSKIDDRIGRLGQKYKDTRQSIEFSGKDMPDIKVER